MILTKEEITQMVLDHKAMIENLETRLKIVNKRLSKNEEATKQVTKQVAKNSTKQVKKARVSIPGSPASKGKSLPMVTNR